MDRGSSHLVTSPSFAGDQFWTLTTATTRPGLGASPVHLSIDPGDTAPSCAVSLSETNSRRRQPPGQFARC